VVFQPSQNVVVPVQVKDGPSDMGDIFCARLRTALVQSGRYRLTEEKIPRVVIEVIEAPATIADGEIVGCLVLLFEVDDTKLRYPLRAG